MIPASNHTRRTYLSIQAVAEELDVSTRTVRRWIKAGDLPALKIGRHWRISRRDLGEFLLLCRRRGAPMSNKVR